MLPPPSSVRPPGTPGQARTRAVTRPARCNHGRQPGQPSSALSIFKGVQQPTETLPTGLEARQRVSALYQTHALALKKLAFLMTGDQPTAEDIVQDAFLGLCRRWPSLHETDNALGYLRTSVLNGCRSVHRVRFRRQGITLDAPADSVSAEDLAIAGRGQPRGPGRDPAAAGQTARGRRPPLLPGHDRRPGRPGDGRQPGHREVSHLPGHRRPRSHARGDPVSTEEPHEHRRPRPHRHPGGRHPGPRHRPDGRGTREGSLPPPPGADRAPPGCPGGSRSPPRPPSCWSR